MLTSDEQEYFDERAGVYEFMGGLERDEAERLAAQDTEAYRHECEVFSVVRMFNEKGGDHVKNFLLQVEKHRGSDASQRLRSDALNRLKTGEKNDKQTKIN